VVFLLSDDYEKALAELDASETHYVYRCPYDKLECDRNVRGLGFAVCYEKCSDGSLALVCSRYVADVDVFRCSDTLPCNRFENGRYGACLVGGKLMLCCGRFRGVRRVVYGERSGAT